MAQLIRTDGTKDTIHPTNGKNWTESDFQALIGDYEVGRNSNGDYLVRPSALEVFEEHGDSVSFEQLARWKPFNRAAAKTTGYEADGNDWIFGDAILIPEAEIALTPENLEVFGDWGDNSVPEERTRPTHEYCCQDDECGLIFNYGCGGISLHPPQYCPNCGEPGPVRVRSITRKRPQDKESN